MSSYKHTESYPRGEIVELQVRSKVLQNNPLKDPSTRILRAYLPAGYDQSSDKYPVMYYLAAYTNSGYAMSNWNAFAENIPERLDRLIAQGTMGPVIMLFPDCFTRLGGNQYIDSSAVGSYASHIHNEIVPLVENELRAKKGAAHRAVLGKSSGGFAAIRYAMDFPGHWGAIANHSGDCGFDVLYQRDFPAVADVLSGFNGDIDKFIRRFWGAKKIMGSHILALMHICMAATYDPQEDNTIRLPFDLHSCQLDHQRWSRWMRHDPVTKVSDCASGLKQLNGLYMDCGYRDQYYIHYGMRQLSAELEKAKIEHTYEEFNGTHSGIDYRLDESLPFLYKRIK